MDRKLIRPSLPRQGASTRRKGAHQGAEAGYLQQARDTRAPFVVQMLGGAEHRGRLEGHDREALILAREGRPLLVLRRDGIRCFWMERSAPQAAGEP